MALYLGAAGYNDSDRVFGETQHQRIIYDAIQAELVELNTEMNAAKRIFVGGSTTDYKLRYKLPAIGRMEKRRSRSSAMSIKANGGWDVGFPLEDYGIAFETDRVDLAYMTAGDIERHFNGIMNTAANEYRFQMLKCLFTNTSTSFVDERYGTITVQCLANGDGTLYPPVLGSTAEADQTLYAETGYAASAISDTNNPIKTIVDTLEPIFGTPTGGSNIVVFINRAQTAKISALADFTSVTDMAITPGDQTATVNSIPAELTAPATWRILGRCDTNSAWIVEWAYVPANYLVARHLGAEAPIYERIDMLDTGLGSGLQLLVQDEENPFRRWEWGFRFGFGVANRLNGMVLECGTGGTYTIPTIYQ